MPTLGGALRRWALAPSLRRVSLAGRGVAAPPPVVVRRLDAVPQAVVCGFEWGMDTSDQWELERRLALVDVELRGFAYEGAVMALTIRDATRLTGRGNSTGELLGGHGASHLLLSYIGIGFAMARLPRALWHRVLPDLPRSAYHPTMSWLAIDGYGFDLAYFDADRWVAGQEVPRPYPWRGRPEYFPRAVDQGIGRALWFTHGADPDRVCDEIARFDAHRRGDLWSGVGLAATFAGGCDTTGLLRLREATGEHWTHLAVGAVFAVEARTRAEHVPAHTADGVRLLAGITVAEASRLAAATAVDGSGGSSDDVPAYEAWRARIRDRLAPQGLLAVTPPRERGHP